MRQGKGLSRHADIAKAFAYGAMRWRAFNRFLYDGQLEPDNLIAAERSAVVLSIIATCKLCGVDAAAYMADVTEHIQNDRPASRWDRSSRAFLSTSRRAAERKHNHSRRQAPVLTRAYQDLRGSPVGCRSWSRTQAMRNAASSATPGPCDAPLWPPTVRVRKTSSGSRSAAQDRR
ncbi:transposase, partial [Mesorhizobium sp. M2A.F.Ca.ET.037.01.1.1]